MGKKIALFAFCVLCITFALIGCGGGGGGGTTGNPVGPVAVTGPVADLSGTVRFADQPLADAAVYLYKSEKALQAGVSGLYALRGSVLAQTKLAEGSYSTKSDSTGRYSFTNIPVGEYTLIAVKDEAHQFAQTGVLLGSVTTADAQLTPTGKVSGRLLLAGGQAARGAIVHLEKTSYVAISDLNGDFTINHVPAGQNFTLGVVSTQGTLQQPVAINITPAEDRQLGNLTLAVPVQQVSTINGSVGAADSSVPTTALNGRIVLVTSAEPTPLVALTDASGNFSLNVKNIGNYNVSVVGGEFAVAPTVQTVAVSALGTTVTVPQSFVLSKPAIVLPPTTQFYTYSGTISKRNKAFNEPDNAGVPLTLTSTDAAANVWSAVTSPTGSFTFSIPAGTYNLAVGGGYAFETAFANPVAISAPTVLNNVIWVVPTQVFTANFLVEGSLTKVTRVNGETDDSNVIVTLTPTTGAAVTFAGATTPTGSFAIRVPAGTYNLAVTGAYKFETAFANPVTVNAATNAGTDLRLIPVIAPVQNFLVTGTAQKSVFAEGELTHAGITIVLTSTAGQAQTFTGMTDILGAFSIGVPAGNYSLSVISSSYKPGAGAPTTFAVSANTPLGTFSVVPAAPQAQLFTLGGTALKTRFVDGETTHAGVTIALTPTSGSGNTYSAVSTGVGSFSMQVPAGSYNLSVISSLYKPAITLPNPVNITANQVLATFNLNPINSEATRYFVEGWLHKSVLADGDSGNGGVVVTLTSTSAMPVTYNTVTDANGYFKLFVAPDFYNIGVGGGYKFDPSVARSPIDVTTADQTINSGVTPYALIPLAEKIYTIPGSVSKFIKKPGDFNEGGVAVTLRSDDPTVAPQVAITDSFGNFVFKAASGTYTIEIGSGYTYDADYGGIPVSVKLPDDTSIMTIMIVPDSTQLGIVRGMVSSPISNSYTVRLREISPGTFVDIETTAPGNGQFAFYNVPAGNYAVTVMPDENGQYVYSGAFSLGAGEDVSVGVLTAIDLKPLISSVLVSENYLDLTGGNFESLPVNPATTRMFVDGIRCSRAPTYTSYSNEIDQCLITSVVPGTHTVVIEKVWTSGDTAEVFVIRSEPYTFVKPIGQPLVFIDDIGSNYAVISWKNQKFTQDSIVEVQLAGTVVGTYDVTGERFTVPDLTPENLYSIYVYNRYGDLRSQPGLQIIKTHAVANYGVSNRVFAGTGSNPNPVFGFEVINGISYVARYNSSTGLYVYAYNPDGTASATSYFRNIEELGSSSSFSFCSDNSNLYLIYTHPTGPTTYIDRINPANLDIDAAVQATVNVGTAGWFEHNDLLFAGGKLFNVGSRDTGSQHRTVFEIFTSPTTDLSVATIISTDDQANSTSLPTARLCADSNFIYRCRLADGTGNNLVVEKFPITVGEPAVPVLVAKINGNMPVAVSEFAAGRGELFLKASFSSPTYDFYIDPLKGSYVKKDGNYRGNYAIDGRGRIWMGGNGPSYIQVSGDSIIELPVVSFPVASPYPSPAEFLKLDPVTGSFNMLYRSGNNDLSVYYYSSDY